MLFVVSMSIPVVIVPAVLAIIIILKNKKLQTNNNIFLINLLLTDIGFAVVLWCKNGLLTVLYLLGVNVDVDYGITMLILYVTLLIVNKLMFIPTCVERFIHIAFPFSYKRTVTKKAVITTIITLWMLVIVIVTLMYALGTLSDLSHVEYIPSLGVYHQKQVDILFLLVILGCFLISIVTITITSIYLRYRIIKSKNFFHSVKRNAAQERKSITAGRLTEILEEQVKPTLAVFRVGGIDAVLDILLALIIAVANLFILSDTLTYIVIIQFVGIPIQYLQSVNHALVYNVDIREKMINGCIRPKNKRSKVIVLHKE